MAVHCGLHIELEDLYQKPDIVSNFDVSSLAVSSAQIILNF